MNASGVQLVNPRPGKRANYRRDAAWADAKALQFAKVARDPDQCRADYWLDWLEGCREAGLNQTGIARLEQLVSPRWSDTHALNVIAAVLSTDGYTGAAAATAALFVRATGRDVEPFDLDDEDDEEEDVA